MIHLGFFIVELIAKTLQILALQPGLEPGTCGLTVRRSTDWAMGEWGWHFRCYKGSGQDVNARHRLVADLLNIFIIKW